MKLIYCERGLRPRQVHVEDTRTKKKAELPMQLWWNSNLPPWDWGCYCQASLHLACAILHYCCAKDSRLAISLAGAFLDQVVAQLPKDEWAINDHDVIDWVERQTVALAPSRQEEALNGQG